MAPNEPLVSGLLTITVCYALPDAQILLECRLPQGSTLAEAIHASGVLQHLPDQHRPGFDLQTCKTGIFGKIQPLATVLKDGDRVELYRPLQVDPKVARQRRVEKIRAAGSVEGRKWQPKESR